MVLLCCVLFMLCCCMDCCLVVLDNVVLGLVVEVICKGFDLCRL